MKTPTIYDDQKPSAFDVPGYAALERKENPHRLQFKHYSPWWHPHDLLPVLLIVFIMQLAILFFIVMRGR